ncbi:MULTISPECIES: GIY-YIG nuclease family protein [unclassified Pantoea]|uniref:GIY-YIG nuclease family protein n=1 Tax=unclassified Pantoea TaxID=2630326 RepID=UPI00226AD081|nr:MULTISPECIES: GIY-YIG nuclease family protein [unclassified Pantoea]
MADLNDILKLTSHESMPIPEGFTPCGWVYVLANESMPGVYKVGMTNTSPEKRAKELSGSTGVPTPFIVISRFRTNNPWEHEKQIHQLLSRYRVNQGREFFKASIEVIDEVCDQVIPNGGAIDVDQISSYYNLVSLDTFKTPDPYEALESLGVSAYGGREEVVDIVLCLGCLVIKKMTENGGALVVHNNGIRLVGADEEVPE